MAHYSTMQQLADELKTSRRTVSSVINDKARARGISRATELRVREHLLKQGYCPSLHARNLRACPQKSLGILYGGPLYSHLTEAFNALIARFHDGERRVEIVLVRPGEAVRGLTELVGRRVSELVWLHASPPQVEIPDFAQVRGYLTRFSPCVIYNHRFDSNEWDARFASEGIYLVGVDRAAGFNRLGRLLKRLGHRKVCLPTAMVLQTTAMAVQARLGLESAGLHVFPCGTEGDRYELTAEYGQALAKPIQQAMQQQGVTAACFVNSELAGFTMAALARRGVRIPDDLTVTGYGGMSSYAAVLSVPLTTLNFPVPEMIAGVEDILRLPPVNPRHCFSLTVIERASHGPAPTVHASTAGNRPVLIRKAIKRAVDR